ncbi:cobalt transporter CbiM [Clostridium sp. JN-1]|uniref:cobalt transporter CbiM n=1 Tax=Clostridium sp. JN-1 TaxID=2483110 RepID=UPI000F0B5885|nr:cobalt transporter CbiM [Clostridium sp. JN-1]
MHIPDNYLSPSTCAFMGAVMLPVWSMSIKKVKENITKKKMPLLGIGGAFSFLIMMFNVPVPGGTTAHAVGGTLVAIFLGPEAACISVSIALLIQALLFGDGGILAYGANCFNMAFILPLVGYYIYNFAKSRLKFAKGEYLSAFLGSYIGINAAALCASIMFGIQPLLFKDAAGMPMYSPYSLSVSIPAMLIPHMTVAGVLEGLVTAGVFAYVKKASPDMIYQGNNGESKPIYGVIIAMIILTPLGLLAKATAWGEWGADEIKDIVGFVPSGIKNGFNFNAFMQDYGVKGIPETAGYVLSAVAGVAILIIIFKLISSLKKKNINI